MTSGSISNSSRLIAGTPYCLRQEVGELVLLDDAELGERGAEARAGPLLLFLRLAQLLEGDQLLADEQLTEPTGHALSYHGWPTSAGPERVARSGSVSWRERNALQD